MTSGDDGALRRRCGGLARMLQFGDSMFPVGAFSFSNGLESAVQQGVVRDAATLRDFVRTAAEQAASGDGIALVCGASRRRRAATSTALVADRRAVFERKLNEETRTMTMRMGKKLAELGARVTGAPLLATWLDAHRGGRHARHLSRWRWR